MKKRFFLPLFILLSFAITAKAQYAYIPDSSFRVYLKMSFPSCFNGDLIDTTCTDIVNAKGLLNISNQRISDITGIQYFKSIQSLDCSKNYIDTLPPLPQSITFLDCSKNDGLRFLSSLPKSLTNLNCFEDRLEGLPTLPNTLTNLDCSDNPLKSLPPLPNTLGTLICNNTKRILFPSLDSLPTLPNRLNFLSCNNNILKALPALPASLKELYCGSNKLTNLPALPASLNVLSCANNALTNLPALPNSIYFLVCSENKLTALPSLPSSLTNLYCDQNLITGLPVLPTSLTLLDCGFNNIYCLPKLPDSLRQLIIDFGKIHCIPNYPKNLSFIGQGAILGNGPFSIPLCNPATNSNHCTAFPTITGNIFYDNNSNGIKDDGELYVSNVKSGLSNNQYTFTDNNGYYQLGANVGNYTASIESPNYYKAIPSSKTFSFTTYDTSVNLNIALQPTKNVDSVTATIIPAGRARVGFPILYKINYSNTGTTTINTVATVTFDSTLLTYDSSSNHSVINIGNKLIVNESSVVPGQSASFVVYLRIKNTASINDTLKSAITITGNTSIATSTSITMVGGSYDPNDKTATPKLTPQQVQAGKAINYLVRFQNTGNDTAFNIVIADTLSSLLDATSLQVDASSSPCKVTVDSNIVYFEFLNVQLPDSNVNSLGSNGYVSFNIKPKSTVSSGSIENKAAIYFDYNLPVITNTATTLIANADGTNPVKLISFNALQDQDKTTAFLYWSTAEEINTKQFIIEQSSDGAHFSYAGTVTAKGNGGNYSYTTTLNYTNNYYRLKMVDNDGKYSYSPVAVINLKNNSEIQLLNNPVNEYISLKVSGINLNNTAAQLININGVLVKTFLLKQGLQQINISHIGTGSYYIKTRSSIQKITVIQ
ncbi:DUF7619 domain-containing protein [Ferruginibacter albus]|uniref:DUF7619 domain-containing protein n=1 Tax=Ferruginibacter albus TaxID=2875540 RepID=UPI001CC618B1|nr:hypothetical protein [Ferruginibacter albus]UAY53413.1 hypothetical protein K9M53_07005 [Ferruginibacter albus]